MSLAKSFFCINIEGMFTLIIIAAFAATFLGGLFALRFHDKLHLILGFSAGAIIGVAFFDLLPEAVELTEGIYDIDYIAMLVGIGFLLYLIIDRLLLPHTHGHDEEHCTNNRHRSILGVGSLVLHSFLDGAIIGLAFQVSEAVGLVVAFAVLAHRFSDGINIVGMILKHGGNRKQAMSWLAISAISPLVGFASSYFYSMAESTLGAILAVFCGLFIYIGASDLLPESHHSHSTRFTTLMTILGVVAIYLIVKVAHV